MKSKQLAQVIRKMVKEEVQKQVRSILAEQVTENKPFTEPQEHRNRKFTSNSALNDVLNETIQTSNYETLKTFNSSDARAGFAAMQTGFGASPSNPIPDKDINGAPLNPNNVSEDVMKALTRNYSELVKRF